MNTNKAIGSSGEVQALKYLEKQNIRIIEKNFSCKLGEIDIIGMDDDTLCFIEVKKYSAQNLLSVYYAINSKKKSRLIKTAHYYLMHKNKDCPCRFDAILISGELIEYIKGAFTL